MNAVHFDFTGAAVLVTGGTSGIGLAVAATFAGAGADVTVTGTRPAAADYGTDLRRFRFLRLDTTDPDSVDAWPQPSTASTCWSTTPAPTSPAVVTSGTPTGSGPPWP